MERRQAPWFPGPQRHAGEEPLPPPTRCLDFVVSPSRASSNCGMTCLRLFGKQRAERRQAPWFPGPQRHAAEEPLPPPTRCLDFVVSSCHRNAPLEPHAPDALPSPRHSDSLTELRSHARHPRHPCSSAMSPFCPTFPPLSISPRGFRTGRGFLGFALRGARKRPSSLPHMPKAKRSTRESPLGVALGEERGRLQREQGARLPRLSPCLLKKEE